MNTDGKYVFEIKERTIVPTLTSQVAVSSDINARRIVFKVPATIDGYDVRQSNFTVRCLNAAGALNEYSMTNKKVVIENNATYIYVEWIMDGYVTQKSGVVKYDVSIYDATKSIYAWHSLPSTFNVEAGISEINSD